MTSLAQIKGHATAVDKRGITCAVTPNARPARTEFGQVPPKFSKTEFESGTKEDIKERAREKESPFKETMVIEPRSVVQIKRRARIGHGGMDFASTARHAAIPMMDKKGGNPKISTNGRAKLFF